MPLAKPVAANSAPPIRNSGRGFASTKTSDPTLPATGSRYCSHASRPLLVAGSLGGAATVSSPVGNGGGQVRAGRCAATRVIGSSASLRAGLCTAADAAGLVAVIVATVASPARDPVHRLGSDRLCRLTVVGPRRQVDLAVPAHVRLTTLLPDLVRLVGEAAQPDVAPGAWELGRLGDPPLAMDRTLAGYGVLDGEALYLTDSDQPLGPAVIEVRDPAGGHVTPAYDVPPGAMTPTSARRPPTGLVLAALLLLLGLLAALVTGLLPR